MKRLVLVDEQGGWIVLGPSLHDPRPGARVLDLSMSSGPPPGGISVRELSAAFLEEYDETQG